MPVSDRDVARDRGRTAVVHLPAAPHRYDVFLRMVVIKNPEK